MRTRVWLVAGALILGGAGPAVAEDIDTPQVPGRGAHLSGEANRAPARTKVTFYAGLQRPESGAEQALRSVSDPASATYRNFPSRRRVAAKYGAPAATVRAVRRSAQKSGLKVTLDDTGVFAAVQGTAGQMGDWLGKPVKQQTGTRGGLRATFLSSRGLPPKDVRAQIVEFIAVDVQVTASSLAYAGTNDGSPRSCLPSASPKVNRFTYSYNQLRTAYGVDSLPATAAVGRRSRVTVLAQGDGFSRTALYSSALCFGLPEMAFKRVSVPGLAVSLPVGDEGNLDVQVVQSVLPADSTVTVVESAGFDQRDFLSWSTAFGQKRLPHVVTTSYGYCEPELRFLPPGTLSLTESVLLRLSLAGTSLFAATGDRGSSDCINNSTGRGPKRKAVDYPAASPHVTAVGGTRITLDAGNQRTAEVVWNATRLSAPLGPEELAGGGGSSRIFTRPWWQAEVVGGSRRALPDISAHAAGAPAWPLFSVDPQGQVFVGPVGGTSAAAPFVAASVGLIAAKQKTPFGLLQPALYSLPDSAVFDVTKGSNDLHNLGCCQATVGYDRASGLGTPRFERWLRDLPKPR